MKVVRKTQKLGDESYLKPFISNGFWISDANGRHVAECRSQEVAKALVNILNSVDKEKT